MFKLGDDLYYAHSDGKLAIGVERVSRGNGYVADYYEYPFDEDGKLYNGIYEENSSLVYYVNGTKMGGGVYYNVAGDYYVYVRSTGICATGWYEVKSNDLIESGMRYFGEDGKMYTGVLNENGALYFYRHGLKQGRGVHYVEKEDYYVYVRSTGTLATGKYEVKSNDLIEPGVRLFTDDGRTYTGIYEENGKLGYYYYGIKMGRGLYYNEAEGYHAYVSSNGQCATDRHYVNITNDLLPKDYYDFGADGKLTF